MNRRLKRLGLDDRIVPASRCNSGFYRRMCKGRDGGFLKLLVLVLKFGSAGVNYIFSSTDFNFESTPGVKN